MTGAAESRPLRVAAIILIAVLCVVSSLMVRSTQTGPVAQAGAVGHKTVIGVPSGRQVIPGVAYQATDAAKAAVVTITVSQGDGAVYLGPSPSVAANSGLPVCLMIARRSASNCTLGVPAGWFWAVRGGGQLVVASAYDSPVE